METDRSCRILWVSLSPAAQRTYCPYGANSHLLAPWQEAAQQYVTGPNVGIVGVTPDGRVAALCVVDRVSDTGGLPTSA